MRSADRQQAVYKGLRHPNDSNVKTKSLTSYTSIPNALGKQIVGRSSELRPEAVESLVQPVTAAI